MEKKYKILNIGKDFSPDPSGRYKEDSEASGEVFREDCLKPKIESLGSGEILKIILDDGVEGYGSSFLVEGFAGMVKCGHITSDDLLKVVKFEFTNSDFEFYENKIIAYIEEAEYNSQVSNAT